MSERNHVYVVDDDESIASLVEYRLSVAGYPVTTFANGQECWSHLEDAETVPDGILLDAMMPVLDGFGFLRRFRGTDRYDDVAVVLVTARGAERDVVRGFELGADDYVTKPFSPSELLARLERALG